MNAGRSDIQTVAALLPDLARWVEVRDLALNGSGDVLGLATEPELRFILRDPESAAVFLVGPLDEAMRETALAAIVADHADVVASAALGPWLAPRLPAWTGSRLIVHTLADLDRLSDVPLDPVRWNMLEDLRAHALPSDLFAELEAGAGDDEIAVAWVDDRPVSFCYAGSETETWWDVAIDTLVAYRRRGYAAACAAALTRRMWGHGKRPVWQALDSNPASWRLAERLGFTASDELVMFEAPAQAAPTDARMNTATSPPERSSLE